MSKAMESLQQYKAIDISQSKNGLLRFTPDSKLIDIMKELINHRRISAPVFKGEIDPPSELLTENIQGIVSTLDIVAHLSDLIADTSSLSFDLQGVYADSERDLIKKITVEQLFEKSSTSPLIINDSSISLYDLMETMENNKSRDSIISENGHVLRYITQSDILRALLEHTDLLHPILDCTLEELGFQGKKVFTISKESKAIDAFKLIINQRVSAVGVIDENGTLIGNISSSDIKLIDHDAKYIYRLFNTVGIFLIKVQQFNGSDGTVATCKVSDKLDVVLKRLSDMKIHRLYVVDDENKPMGVVSISDLFALIKNVPKKE